MNIYIYFPGIIRTIKHDNYNFVNVKAISSITYLLPDKKKAPLIN